MATKYAILLLFIVIICILSFIIFSNCGFKEGATTQSSPSSSSSSSPSPSPSSKPSSSPSPTNAQVPQQNCLAQQQTVDIQENVNQAKEAAQNAATSATNAAQYASKAAQNADQANAAVKSLTGDTVEVQLAQNAANNATNYAKKSAQYSKSAMTSSDAASFQSSQAQNLMNVQNLSMTAGTNAQFSDYTYQAQMYSQYARQSAENAKQQEYFALQAQQQAEQQLNAAQQAAKTAQVVINNPSLSVQQQSANGSAYCSQTIITDSNTTAAVITATTPAKPTKSNVFKTDNTTSSQTPVASSTPAIMKKNTSSPGSTTPSTTATPSQTTAASSTTPAIMKTTATPASTTPSKTTTPSQTNNYKNAGSNNDISSLFNSFSSGLYDASYVKRDLVDQTMNGNQIPLPTQISTNEDFLNAVNSILNMPSNFYTDKIALNIIQGLLSSMRSSNAVILTNEIIQNYNAEPRSILQYMNWFASTCPVDCNSCA